MTDGLLSPPMVVPMQQAALPSWRKLLDALKSGGAGSHLLMIGFDQGVSWNTLSDQLVERVEATLLGRLRRIAGPRAVYRGTRDTFLLTLEVADDDTAISIAEHLVDVVNRAMLLEGRAVHLHSAVGIAAIDPDIDGEATLQHARIAMMEARQAAEGGVSNFSSAMLHLIDARRDLETDLRRALSLNEFALVFQPQYDIASRRLTGFEALIRWPHERRGLVSPAEFIPLAEDLGLIRNIGAWVLNEACLVARRWPADISVSVNVSPAQLGHSDFEATVENALRIAGIDPGRLELEVTEGVLLPNDTNLIVLIERLRRLGVRFALDDFGTGYSSLAYLQRFSFDKLKIDQAFVRSAPSKANWAILRAAIGIAQALGMNTIAEGVETEDQLALVRDAGCSQVQGYLTGRPVSANDATRIANVIEARSDL